MNLRESRHSIENLYNQKLNEIEEMKKQEENQNNQINNLNLEIYNLKYKITDMESIQQINNIEKGNLSNENGMQNEEINRQQLIIKKQEEIITGLQENLIKEMKEHEQNNNRLGTTKALLHSINLRNEELETSKTFFEDKYNNMESLYTQLSMEYDSFKFKFNQLNKDFIDNLVKMKIAVKTRQNAEKFNEQMRKRVIELEQDLNELNLNYSESKYDNEILRKKLKEQDYSIAQLTDTKEQMNKSVEKQNAH